MYKREIGLYIAHGPEGPLCIEGKMASRHGLIAGATGTGKTVTLQVLAETFCQAGVPCFMADMKGDLSGIGEAGCLSPFIEKRIARFGMDAPEFQPCPVRFFDVYGEQGHPMRTTVSDMGPQLLARLLDLNEVQSGILNMVFRIADDRKLLLLDMKDLRLTLDFVARHASEFSIEYGQISPASVGAIRRALLDLESQGGNLFFGEPAFDIYDLLQTEGGKGVMNVLAADKLMLNPKLYSTFLLWLLSELYSTLPEVGELDLPKLVFFFDEAHLLFEDTSKALTAKIEQVVRLIRSKGVGIYFVTQSPTDLPEDILGQLGNRVQHALRAYTPKDQKTVKATAATFRPNPAFKTEDVLMNLETGEALVSFLDGKGAPSVVQRAAVLFPLSQIGAISESRREHLLRTSRIYGKYDQAVDRESAFEILTRQREEEQAAAAGTSPEKSAGASSERAAGTSSAEKAGRAAGRGRKKGIGSVILGAAFTAITASLGRSVGSALTSSMRGGRKSGSTVASRAVGSAASAATRTATREFARSILGNLIR